MRLDLPDAEITLHEGWLAPEDAARLFRELRAGAAWRQDAIRLFGRERPIPRLQAWYGDPGAAYTYSGLALEPLPWIAPLLELREHLARTLPAARFDSALLSLYRDGRDSIGAHADDEPELGPAPVIASLSLGATRRFVLEHRQDARLAPLALDLEAGTLLVMAGATQRHWKHALPKTARPVTERINASFRRIIVR